MHGKNPKSEPSTEVTFRQCAGLSSKREETNCKWLSR